MDSACATLYSLLRPTASTDWRSCMRMSKRSTSGACHSARPACAAGGSDAMRRPGAPPSALPPPPAARRDRDDDEEEEGGGGGGGAPGVFGKRWCRRSQAPAYSGVPEMEVCCGAWPAM